MTASTEVTITSRNRRLSDDAEALAQFHQSMAELNAKKEKYSVSPFKTYRREIMSGYSTAQRMAALTLHLWNDAYPVRLGSLFANADERHTQIALELMESYSVWGENDPDFMALGREIYERDIASNKSKES